DVGLDVGESGEGLDHGVVNALVGVGAALAEAADRDIDEVGPDRAHRGLTDTHPLGHAGAEILHEEVRALYQPPEHFKPTWIVKVEHDRALVAVDHREGGRDAAPRPAHRAGKIAGRRLDLDHVGALVAEDHRAHRARQILGQVDDANSAERSCHIALPRRCARAPADQRKAGTTSLAIVSMLRSISSWRQAHEKITVRAPASTYSRSRLRQSSGLP